MSRSKRIRNCEKGGALIEFAMLMPLLLLLAIGGAEIGRAISAREAAIALSKAAANQAFRECTHMTQGKMTLCLNDIRNQFQTFASQVFPGTSVVVKVFTWDPDTGAGIEAQSATGGKVSQFDYNASSGLLTSHPSTISNSIVQQRRILVVGEAYVPFDHIAPYTAQIFDVTNGEYYESTIG